MQYWAGTRQKLGISWLRLFEIGALLLAAPALLFPTRWPLVTLAVLILLVLAWILQSLLAREPWPVTPFNAVLLLFSVMIGVGIAVTPLPKTSLPKATGLILGMAVFRFFGGWVSNRLRLVLALLAFALVGMGILGVGLLGANWGNKIPALQSVLGRLPSLSTQLPDAPDAGINPNQLAGALTLYLPLAVVSIFGWRPRGRRVGLWLLALAGLLTVGTVLILTQSRAGWVGAIAGLATLGFLAGVTSQRRRVRRAAMFAGLVILLLGVVAVLLLGGVRAVGETLYNRGTKSSLEDTVGTVTMEGRVEIWSRALYAIADFPFTGCGLGTFREVVWTLYPLFVIRPGFDIAHAHNIFLQTALDLGLPGLVAYIALLIIGLAVSWRMARVSDPLLRGTALGLAAGLAGLHVYGLADAVALGSKPGLAFWIALAIIAVLPCVQRSQELPAQ
jgi:putative inorganic carbon (HCO3(-)) transporter